MEPLVWSPGGHRSRMEDAAKEMCAENLRQLRALERRGARRVPPTRETRGGGHLRDGEEQTDVGWVKLLVFGRMYGEGGVDVEEVKRGEKHC